MVSLPLFHLTRVRRRLRERPFARKIKLVMLEKKRYRPMLQQVRRGEQISTNDNSVNIKDTERIVPSKRLDSEGIFDAIVRYFGISS
jgi:hypothetical protein